MKRDYDNLIVNNEWDKILDIPYSDLDILINHQYLNRYLIEYLLERGIHTPEMDTKAKTDIRWIKYYLQYNITKPLLNLRLTQLLKTFDNKLVLDHILAKLTNDERLELYHNLKKNCYWQLHDYEQDINKIYLKYGIELPKIFIDKPLIIDSKNQKYQKNQDIIKEFTEVFHDTDQKTINTFIHEFKRRLSIDHIRARSDLEKIIQYKKDHPTFNLRLSADTEGEYDSELEEITISPYRGAVVTHEISHLMYDNLDNMKDDEILIAYKNICSEINKPSIVKRIITYLGEFHKHYADMANIFEELYYHEIKKKYGSYHEYIKAICTDIYYNYPEVISADNGMLYFFINDDNIEAVATELLFVEKNEFINISVRNYYTEELMLENLLDAVLEGKICDGEFDIICHSGHPSRDFMEENELSFNECLADYDAIKNSKKGPKLINDLKILVGNELIELLDNYLVKNRGGKHGK